jgi:hypothetical protein
MEAVGCEGCNAGLAIADGMATAPANSTDATDNLNMWISFACEFPQTPPKEESSAKRPKKAG